MVGKKGEGRRFTAPFAAGVGAGAGAAAGAGAGADDGAGADVRHLKIWDRGGV